MIVLINSLLELIYCLQKVVCSCLNLKKKLQIKKLDILHHSNNFIVLNKKYDVLINSNDPSVSESLHYQLSEAFPNLINPKLKHNFHFVHRLDYATSGVICVALNKKAATAATLSFEKRSAKKYYIALVRGHLALENLDISVPIGELASEVEGNHKMCVEGEPGCISARSAHTRLVVLERGIYARYPATKVLLQPTTGRRHQLRVHCSYIGHTIVGDFTYSRKKDISPHRTFLHALRLVLPNSLEPLDIQSPDPFKNTNDPINGWEIFETVNNLDKAFNTINTNQYHLPS